jgi:hypothetical protein
MSSRDKKRAAMLEKLKQCCDVQEIMAEAHCSAQEIADVVLKFEAHLLEWSGGPPQFTGNNRTYANGTVAYEVRCKGCRGLFWVTTLPTALCPDCDDGYGLPSLAGH